MRVGTIVIKIQMRKRFRTAAATPGQNSNAKALNMNPPKNFLPSIRIIYSTHSWWHYFHVGFQQKTYPAPTHTENTKSVENTNFCEHPLYIDTWYKQMYCIHTWPSSPAYVQWWSFQCVRSVLDTLGPRYCDGRSQPMAA